jgi:hypothetical protein
VVCSSISAELCGNNVFFAPLQHHSTSYVLLVYKQMNACPYLQPLHLQEKYETEVAYTDIGLRTRNIKKGKGKKEKGKKEKGGSVAKLSRKTIFLYSTVQCLIAIAPRLKFFDINRPTINML